MSGLMRDEQVSNNATITATGNSSTFTNDGRAVWTLVVRIANSPTGTTPTITYAVQVSMDGSNWIQVGAALAALNSATTQRTVYAINSTQGPIVEPNVRVAWTVTGTTPSFTGVFVDLVGLGFYD